MATGPALPWVPESLGMQPTRTALSLLHPLPSPPKAKEEGRAGGQGFQLEGRRATGRAVLFLTGPRATTRPGPERL